MSVKPHASPVLHAIEYLLGELDERYLDDAARVRRAAELPEPAQGPGPGRLLDRLGRDRRHRPDLGRAGPPLRRRPRSAPAARHRPAVLAGRRRRAGRGRGAGRPCSTRWSPSSARSSGSSTSTGSPWTASSPTSAPPGCRACSPPPAGRCSPSSTGGCWRSCSPAPAATRCGDRIDDMTNPEYQRLLRCTAAELRERLPGDGPERPSSPRWSPTSTTTTLHAAVRNLGGHDLHALRDGVRRDRRHPADGDLRLHASRATGWPPRGTRRTTPRC